MVTFEEAYDIILGAAFLAGTHRIGHLDSSGRILAEDIISDMAMPPFDKAAVDGYACRKQDLDKDLKVIEILPAGKFPEQHIRQGECSRIMTGAMVPQGADVVIMVEDTVVTNDGHVRFTSAKTNVNICYQAEDLREGDIVLKRGTFIRPQEIAVMASVGCISPLVYQSPGVGIISTGDELVEPGQKPGLSQIRNSNASQIAAQLAGMGVTAHYLGIARDDKDSTFSLISRAFLDDDVVILSGGVSMGEYDYVPEVLNEMAFEIKFKSIAIQPGRPTLFGVRGKKLLFGLPGNPVSSFVIFEILVKPLLYKIMGYDFRPVSLKLPMGTDYSRSKSKRKTILPVRINDEGFVMPVDYHGSAHIHAYAYADGIITMNIGETIIKKGDIVSVRPV
ncbi:MAG: molybdopterin molybdotransferase MoeA [Bacteroidetes bacterium]|nr:molybdopterin molybdotransferase MoeA [Bacteroidota bacterium]